MRGTEVFMGQTWNLYTSHLSTFHRAQLSHWRDWEMRSSYASSRKRRGILMSTESFSLSLDKAGTEVEGLHMNT